MRYRLRSRKPQNAKLLLGRLVLCWPAAGRRRIEFGSPCETPTWAAPASYSSLTGNSIRRWRIFSPLRNPEAKSGTAGCTAVWLSNSRRQMNT